MSASLTRRSSTVSFMTDSMTSWKRSQSERCCTFSIRPEQRLSSAVTLEPRFRHASARWLPIKPAPPVMRTLCIAGLDLPGPIPVREVPARQVGDPFTEGGPRLPVQEFAGLADIGPGRRYVRRMHWAPVDDRL